ncbi:unnamed protein product [marine sediment metagenome]|uniref:Uncharacterized protein n=1 Tax=marine sediment metagenome TaxID=412755 RepID=X1TRT1_9ZZZZ
MEMQSRRISISNYDTPVKDFEEIAEKYGLEVEKGETSVWIELNVPEARTEITWFRENENMKTWTITLQTSLNKHILYDELLKLVEKLKITGFHIHNFEIEGEELEV